MSPGLFRIDVEDGTLALDAIDVLDGTPVIDMKPYFASIDSVPEATVGRPKTADGRHQPPARHRQGADRAAAAGALYRRGEDPRRRRRAALKTLPPSIAVWLATVAHVRHVHTDYEKLLGEGYDRDSGALLRRSTRSTNAVLTRWRATRLLDPDDEEDSEAAATVDIQRTQISNAATGKAAAAPYMSQGDSGPPTLTQRNR